MFCTVLVTYVTIYVTVTTRVSLRRGVAGFFNDSGRGSGTVFSGLGMGSGVVIVISNRSPSTVVRTTRAFRRDLTPLCRRRLIHSIAANTSSRAVTGYLSFVCSGLPVFLARSSFTTLRRHIASRSVSTSIDGTCGLLASPSKVVMKSILLGSPLNVKARLLSGFRRYGPSLRCRICKKHLFAQSFSAVLVFVRPDRKVKSAKGGGHFITLLRRTRGTTRISKVDVSYVKKPVITICGTHRVGRSATVALSVTLTFVLLILFFSFHGH